jgi:hypothetical protein
MNTSTLPVRPERPLPFTPQDIPVDKTLIRAAASHFVAAALGGPSSYPERVCRQLWPKDPVALALVTRAPTAPATIGGAGWADALAAKATAAFIGSLQSSAASRLIAASLQINIPGVATITLPRASFSAGSAPLWVAEAGPIPVGQALILAPMLGPPKKLGLIEVFSRELAEGTPESIEATIGTVLRDVASRALDLSLFSATAGDATRPAGLLVGLTPVTAATATAGAMNALSDLRALTDVIVGVGGSGDIAFVCSPGRALAIATYAPTARVFGSAAIPDAQLIAVDVNSFTSMFPAEPEILASKTATLHFEDTTPAQIGTVAGPPNVVAAPTRSLFQQDEIALRLILKATWALRVPASVAVITTGMNW